MKKKLHPVNLVFGSFRPFTPESRARWMLVPRNDLLYSLRPFQGTFSFSGGGSLFLAKLVFSTTNGQIMENASYHVPSHVLKNILYNCAFWPFSVVPRPEKRVSLMSREMACFRVETRSSPDKKKKIWVDSKSLREKWAVSGTNLSLGKKRKCDDQKTTQVRWNSLKECSKIIEMSRSV